MKTKKIQHESYDFLEYIGDLKKEDQEWVRQFYNEFYFGNATENRSGIIKGKEMKTEANRNHNIVNNDALVKGRKENEVVELDDYHIFMEDVCDENDWHFTLKMFGCKDAFEQITDQCYKKLKDKNREVAATLALYHSQVNELIKLEEEDIKNNGDVNEEA